MAIKYYLQKNAITTDPDDYSARVESGSPKELGDLINEMMKRGTTLDRVELEGALDLFFRVVAEQLADGAAVHTPVANFRPGIKGVFHSVGDSFDRSRHTIKASLTSGLSLIEAMQNASVEKTTTTLPSPALTQYTDYGSSTTDSILTPGNIGMIIGEELKFDPNNAAEGVFLIDSSGTETKVSTIASRTEGKLVFMIPDSLASGIYKLQVRRAYTKNVTIRIGELNDELEVN